MMLRRHRYLCVSENTSDFPKLSHGPMLSILPNCAQPAVFPVSGIKKIFTAVWELSLAAMCLNLSLDIVRRDSAWSINTCIGAYAQPDLSHILKRSI